MRWRLLPARPVLPRIRRRRARSKRSRQFGTLSVCAHPNSLPFSSRRHPPGFQVELGRALAHEFGVSLETDWVISPIQVPRANCDFMLDVIADPEAQEERGSCCRSPIIAAAWRWRFRRQPDRFVRGTEWHTKVAVQVGSIAAMTLDQRHVRMTIYGFEDDMLQASGREVDAAAVTPISAGYYNKRHPGHELTILPPDEAAPALSWNVAVGMRSPDDALKTAIDEALVRLTKDGTIASIYSRYGVTLEPPKL